MRKKKAKNFGIYEGANFHVVSFFFRQKKFFGRKGRGGRVLASRALLPLAEVTTTSGCTEARDATVARVAACLFRCQTVDTKSVRVGGVAGRSGNVRHLVV